MMSYFEVILSIIFFSYHAFVGFYNRLIQAS